MKTCTVEWLHREDGSRAWRCRRLFLTPGPFLPERLDRCAHARCPGRTPFEIHEREPAPPKKPNPSA